MMNANVRRLVFDYSSRLVLWMNVGFLALIALLTWLWATKAGPANFMVMVSANAWGVHCTTKTPIWQTLPTSRSDQLRAQWWGLMGLPYLTMATIVALPVAIAAGVGALRVSGVEVLAYLMGALTALFFNAVVHLSRPFLQKVVGPKAAANVIVIPLLGWLFLGFQWSSDNFNNAELPIIIGVGLVVILLTGLLFKFSGRLQLIQPYRAGQFASLDALLLPPWFAPKQAGSKIRKANWWQIFEMLLAQAASFGGPAMIFMLFLFFGVLRLAFQSQVSSMIFLPYFPLLSLVGALSLLFVMPQRVFGALPVTVFERTLALQLLPLALGIASLGVILIFAALLHPVEMTTEWMVRCGIISLGGIAVGAAIIPVQLRFNGMSAGGVVVLIASAGAGLTVGAATGGLNDGISDFARLIVVAGMALTLVASWIWTYRALAYSRDAYRDSPLAAANWRGAPS